MSISIKGNNISRNRERNPATFEDGGTLEDVSGQITPSEKISNQEVAQGQEQAEEIREGFNDTASKTKDLYTYDRLINAERFGRKAERAGTEDIKNEKGNPATDQAPPAAPREGVPSMFNPYSVFVHGGSNQSKNEFFDLKDNADNSFPKYTNPQAESGGREISMESLLRDFSPDGKPEDGINPSRPYYASDFLYSKYYGKIPLNRLITLRRFPFPTYDNLEFAGDGSEHQFKPISQAVTYFGEPTGNDLSELTGIAGQINWEELTADVHDVEGNEQGFDASPAGGTGSIGRAVNAMTNPNGQDLGGFRAQEIEAQKYNTFEYTNKVLGPVNVVNQTHVRKRGIGARMEFSIDFEYELRSYNNINPRLAMLDLLCNMLALTFNNAKFWGGANRYFPRSPQFGFLGNEDAFYQGRYGDYMDSVIGQITTGIGDAFSKIGSMISGILSGDFSGLTDVAKGAGKTFMDLKRAKSRPKVLGFHALLSGLPIGEWHMTVGNPYRPIMNVGNLICEGFDFEMSDNLGVDDFPSGMKFTINLKSGRPRDKGDIESIFNLGQGRMYYPPEGLMDVTNSSAAAGNVNGGSPSAQGGGGGIDPTAPITVVGGRRQTNTKDNVDADFARKMIGTNY